MSLQHSPKIVTDGLAFYYDMSNTKKSWIGRPITNSISSSSVISRYNNPGFSGTSTNTGLTYKGAPIYELTFIAQDSSYISRLASTEGFGATHTMGLSLQANTRYMSSIYMRSDHPLQVSGTQGFNNTYSNISGWGQNSTSTTRYTEEGWTRLYTQYLINTNGYASRNLAFPNQYGNGTQFTVNTTQTTTVDLSVTVPANGSGIPDFAYFYAIVAASPAITVNGGLTGISILDHGLDTTNFTKLSWPSNIKLAAQLPFTYYFRVSVPSTGGVNTNITIASNFTSYTTAISDSKYWKLTFDVSNVSVGQILRTYWCCPMIEQHDTVYPSTYVNGTRSNTEAIKDLVGSNTITTNSLTYNNDGSFSFNGTSDYITIPQPSIQVSPNRWTISGWIKPNVNQDTFFLTPQSAGVDHFLALTSTGQFRFSITESADVNNRTYYSPAGTVPAGSWTHFSASIDNLTIKLFLNGVQHINQTETIPIANWSGNWIIGQRGNNTFWLNGNISGLSVYNKALSDSEVKQNFNALRGRYGV
jgi:Concanavalin A-like lectin/glucanases superfamily